MSAMNPRDAPSMERRFQLVFQLELELERGMNCSRCLG